MQNHISIFIIWKYFSPIKKTNVSCSYDTNLLLILFASCEFDSPKTFQRNFKVLIILFNPNLTRFFTSN